MKAKERKTTEGRVTSEERRTITVSVLDPHQTFTKFCFHKRIGHIQGFIFIFIQFFIVGIIQGYGTSVEYILQQSGITFAQQSLFSTVIYPYSYRFFISPLLDRYYLRQFGRSRTYTVFAGITISFLFCFLGHTIEEFIKNKQIGSLTAIFLTVNFVVIFHQIACEAWITTLFAKQHKSKASLMVVIGQTFGSIIGYNVFVPLNSVDWIQKHLYPHSHVAGPILTHQVFLYGIGIVTVCATVYNVLFVAEEIINDDRTMDLCRILSVLPKSITNRNMRNLIGYVFITRIFYNMMADALSMKLVKNGYMNVEISTVSSIELMLYPLCLVISFWNVSLIRKGTILKMYHMLMVVIVLIGFFKWMIYENLIRTKDIDQTYYLLLVQGTFSAFTSISDGFLVGYFNIIIHKSVASTTSCLLNSMRHLGYSIPKTTGYYLASKVDFSIFCFVCLSVQLACLILTFAFTFPMDKRGKKE